MTTSSNQFDQVGGSAANFAESAEVEQFLGDPLAAISFLFDPPQVGHQRFAEFVVKDSVFGIEHRQLRRPRLQRLGAPGDRGERIVDLVSHAGRQKTDARQLLVLDHFARPFADLAVKIGAPRFDLGQGALKAIGHVVHRLGQFTQFIARSQINAMVELTAGDEPRAVDQACGTV